MTFEPDYRYEDLVAKKDWEFRKIYSEDLYLSMPGFKKEIAFKSKEEFRICIRIKGEVFGDPMGFPLNETDLIRIYIKNSEDKIENVLLMNVTNINLGEVSCMFDEFTFRKKGVYNFVIKLNDIILSNNFQIIIK